MISRKALDRPVEALAEECPVWGAGPNHVTVLGPDAIRLGPDVILLEICGYDVDAKNWLDGAVGNDRRLN